MHDNSNKNINALNDPYKLYQDLVETSQNLIWQCDSEGRYIYLNPAWEKTFGYKIDEMLGKKFTHFQTVEMANRDMNEFYRLLKGENVIGYETKHISKSGEEIYLIFSAKCVYDDNNNIIGTRGMAYDVTKRKLAEEQLKQSHELLEKLASLVPSAIYQYRLYPDGHSCFPYSSPGINEIYEVTPDEVKEDASIVFSRLHPEDLNRIVDSIKESAETLQIFYCEFRVKLPRQGIRWRWCQAHPERMQDGGTLWHGIISDITERKNAEEIRLKYEQQLSQTQKLESLGILAGGIAHDFNNLLGGIFGYIDMAKEESNDKNTVEYLTNALATIERARGLTQQLLTFAKGGEPIKNIENLFPFVQKTAQFALSGSNVSCSFDIQDNLWSCNFDRNQIGQVIDNLVINAQQAMPNGGTIEISAINIALSENNHSTLSSGNFVKISVKDNGIGIPKEVLTRIFDPFYTTKTKGHGLGLATSYSIINRHGGCIEVESELGKGSIFHVYLPASIESISLIKDKESGMHSGKGTFLVMDDEDVIRETIGYMFKSFGYDVIYMNNGNDIISYISSLITLNKLVGMIFDITIPGGMGGKEVIGEVRKFFPNIPIFVASGYAEDPVMANPKSYGFTASISKPFVKEELANMLNKFMHN